MFNSEDGYILDFKAEDKKAQMAVFDMDSDCSTISASEVNSYGCVSPTPPLLCKLRKARVMIKKLPKDILEKYNLKGKKISVRPTQPPRSSGRIKDKLVPGKYLSLHINKPLNEIVKKKKRLRMRPLKIAKQEMRINRNKKSVISSNCYGPTERAIKFAHLSGRSFKTVSKQAKINGFNKHSNLIDPRNINNGTGVIKEVNVNRHSRTLPNSQIIKSNIYSYSSDKRSLEERIAVTGIINEDSHPYKPAVSTLASFPDSMTTEYDIQPNNSTKDRHMNSLTPSITFVRNEPINIPSHTVPNVTPLSTEIHNTVQKSTMVSEAQNNLKAQVPLAFSTSATNSYINSTQSSHAFPTYFTSTPRHQTSCQPMVLDSASSANFQQPKNSTPRMFTIQGFKLPQSLQTQNNTVVVNSPKVLIINQPSLGSDPLDTPYPSGTKKISEKQQLDNGKNTDSDMETCIESDTDFELADTKERYEPEVIKRIIYHTKSVQTKFTCNSSICGLVDSDEFNLNCFYCYDIFPLHKWFEFKEHIKTVHHIEEKENQSDSDEEINNSYSQDRHSANTQTVEISQNIALNNKKKYKTNTANNTKNVKKLPLEPRIIAERQNHQPKELASTLKNPPKPLNRVQNSRKSSKIQLPDKNLNRSCIDEIINLDSDEDNLNMRNVSNIIKAVTKAPHESEKPLTKYDFLHNVSGTDYDTSKIILPTLPHITIKKIRKSSKESIKMNDLDLPNTPSRPISDSVHSQESFIRAPSNINIQQVLKTIPKPTEQLSPNGRTRARYFVVKKVIKIPTTEAAPNTNVTKSMVLPKVAGSEKNYTAISDDYDIPSNNKNEDSVPKPTNGRGIIFGITNSMVVIEFLLKLKTIPELWDPHLKKNLSTSYNESINKLCFHLNNRFDLNITDFELYLSIQRVKYWYSLTLNDIEEHNKNNKTEPYKHSFPLYFKILNQFLSSGVDCTNNNLRISRFQLDTNMNKHLKRTDDEKGTLSSKRDVVRLNEKIPKVEKIKSSPSIIDFKVPQAVTVSTIQPVTPDTAVNTALPEMPADNIIEFDADTLYGEESSDEEFDETKMPNENPNNTNELKKKRTKVYTGHFECDICRKIYKRMCDLKRHKVLHFPPQFECGRCSQKFYFKHWAEKCAHLRRQKYMTGEEIRCDNSTDTPKPKRIWPKKIFRFKMICEICGASYRSIGSLNTHKRDKHLNQREKCVVCNFTALSNWRIVQHQKKRHVVELGTVEEIAKKSRARTETKTRFSNEARQEFFWRREMRNKLKPGEIFYGCCKCRIVFNSRREKVIHNKMEHPIKETTVFCLLCFPVMLLLANSNCARRHYTDIHKVPWHEIDDLVKRTKPIFKLLSKEEIELLKASANYKELLEEFLGKKKLDQAFKIRIMEDEALKAVKNLKISPNIKDEEEQRIDVECTQEENVYVDGIIDHDYDNEDVFNENEYSCTNEDNPNEELEINENYDVYDTIHSQNNRGLLSHDTYDDGIVQLPYDIESNSNKIYNENEKEYLKSIDDFVDSELVEESIVEEECIDEVICEEDLF